MDPLLAQIPTSEWPVFFSAFAAFAQRDLKRVHRHEAAEDHEHLVAVPQELGLIDCCAREASPTGTPPRHAVTRGVKLINLVNPGSNDDIDAWITCSGIDRH